MRQKLTRRRVAHGLSVTAHTIFEVSTVLAILGKGLQFVAGEMYEEPRRRLRIPT